MPRRVEHLLHAHPLRHVEMSAHPDSTGRDLPQQRIELEPGSAVGKRINPHKHTIHLEKLISYFIGRFFAVNRRFRVDVERCERGEDLLPAIVCRRQLALGFAIAAPEQRELSNCVRCHVTTPKASCSPPPARGQASSV